VRRSSNRIAGISAPTLGALQPDGVGLIRFGLDGPLPLLPRGAYRVLSLLAMVGVSTVIWRRWGQLRLGTLVFPSLVLWFAWRSLQNYFSFAASSPSSAMTPFRWMTKSEAANPDLESNGREASGSVASPRLVTP